MVQLFTAWPSTITVHAPHKEVSHPTCVPVRFSTSRMYCTSSRRGSISFWCVTPFTVTLICFFIAPPRIQQQGNFWSQDILNGSTGTCHPRPGSGKQDIGKPFTTEYTEKHKGKSERP